MVRETKELNGGTIPQRPGRLLFIFQHRHSELGDRMSRSIAHRQVLSAVDATRSDRKTDQLLKPACWVMC